ncbi:hypothetical protein [Nocardia otitidiscaviarum]|uniref:hypothetical protein n=1 Tax=Nocardia otitidiscaviarum TaxID=1823 RepID=UPI00189499F4|nr:hypothetical protein [Nocardia otitidiscaviarum]MBF6180091.1 hypothetical protein [Nocardia otitidiscaviarum]
MRLTCALLIVAARLIVTAMRVVAAEFVWLTRRARLGSTTGCCRFVVVKRRALRAGSGLVAAGGIVGGSGEITLCCGVGAGSDRAVSTFGFRRDRALGVGARLISRP